MKGFVLPDFKVLVLLQLLAVLPSVTLILGTCPMGEDKSKIRIRSQLDRIWGAIERTM